MTERLSLNLSKDRSGRKRTERTWENIEPLWEKLIEDPLTSAREYGLDVSKSTLNWITKRGLKCHSYKMHVKKIFQMKLIYWKKIKIYFKKLLQEYEEGCKSVFKEMRTFRMKQKSAAYIEIRIDYVLVLNIWITISFFTITS